MAEAVRNSVEVMTQHGIDTSGRPPVWAWHGLLTLRDAEMLFDPVHELSRGFATITFRAPERLVLYSDYGHWCDALLASGGTHEWEPRRRVKRGCHPEQACLPYLRLDWVIDIIRLPISGWDTLDLEKPL